MLRFSVLLVAICGVSFAAQLDEVFKWKQLDFAWPSEEVKENALKKGDYIPENNLPLGLDRWKNKLFVTVPRWKAGVAASLAYIPLDTNNSSPALIPYPDWDANQLPTEEAKPEPSQIISTFRVKVDPCDRLWVMDTGLADILGEPKQISHPAILVFDLKTDKLIKKYELKSTDYKDDSFFANIIVDVTPDKCDEAYAYLPDLGAYSVVVYSWAENDSWRIKHNFFHFDPLKGDLNAGGVNFQWTDGVFGIALGPVEKDGFRTVYFHPLASVREFSVNSAVWRNKTVATDPHSYHLYKIEGIKGENAQTTASDLDTNTNVLFLTQLNRDGVACWNTKKPLQPENLALFAHDPEALVFTNDIKIDAERNLWILSDRMPVFIYKALDPEQYNYRILKVKTDDAIKDTVCSN